MTLETLVELHPVILAHFKMKTVSLRALLCLPKVILVGNECECRHLDQFWAQRPWILWA